MYMYVLHAYLFELCNYIEIYCGFMRIGQQRVLYMRIGEFGE